MSSLTEIRKLDTGGKTTDGRKEKQGGREVGKLGSSGGDVDRVGVEE